MNYFDVIINKTFLCQMVLLAISLKTSVNCSVTNKMTSVMNGRLRVNSGCCRINLSVFSLMNTSRGGLKLPQYVCAASAASKQPPSLWSWCDKCLVYADHGLYMRHHHYYLVHASQVIRGRNKHVYALNSEMCEKHLISQK